jgi:hypothetical protein
MAYIRGEVYIWHDDADVHVWGPADAKARPGGGGVIISVKTWERLVAAILEETFPERERLWIKAVMRDRAARKRTEKEAK